MLAEQQRLEQLTKAVQDGEHGGASHPREAENIDDLIDKLRNKHNITEQMAEIYKKAPALSPPANACDI